MTRIVSVIFGPPGRQLIVDLPFRDALRMFLRQLLRLALLLLFCFVPVLALVLWSFAFPLLAFSTSARIVGGIVVVVAIIFIGRLAVRHR